MSLTMASGCVFNNYIDRDIDQKMKRTASRPSVTGEISGRAMLLFGSILGSLGFITLAVGTNPLTILIGVIGFIDYVVLYGYTKRSTVHGTLVGSISGAVPPVAGYTAITGHIDAAAILLFVIMTLWQMPHFYAIATFRHNDYRAADLPVLPVKHGILAAKKQLVAYVVAFSLVAPLMTVFGFTGYTYVVGMAVVSIIWIKKAVAGFSATDEIAWARSLFGFSLIVLLTWCLLLSLNAWLP